MNDTESTTSATVLDMRNPITNRGVRLAALVSSLRLEVETGMKFPGVRSNLDAAEQILGVRFTRKALALAAAEDALAAHKLDNAPLLVTIEENDEFGRITSRQKGHTTRTDLVEMMGAENVDFLIANGEAAFDHVTFTLHTAA